MGTASASSMTGARSTMGAELTEPDEEMATAISIADTTRAFGVSLLLMDVLKSCARDLRKFLKSPMFNRESACSVLTDCPDGALVGPFLLDWRFSGEGVALCLIPR